MGFRYRMPIYNDNRRFLASAQSRATIAEAFDAILDALDYNPERSRAPLPPASPMPPRWQTSEGCRFPMSGQREKTGPTQYHRRPRTDGSYHGQQCC